MINDVSKSQQITTTARTITSTTTTATTVMAIPDMQQELQQQNPDKKAATTLMTITAVVGMQQHGSSISTDEGGGGLGVGGKQRQLAAAAEDDNKFPHNNNNNNTAVEATHTFAINNNNNKVDDRDCKQTTTEMINMHEVSPPPSHYTTSGSYKTTTTTVSVIQQQSPQYLEEHSPIVDERQPSTTTNRKLPYSSFAGAPNHKSPSTTITTTPSSLSHSLSVINTTTILPLSLSPLTVKPCSSLLLQNSTTTTLTHKNITNVPRQASYHRTLETETSSVNSRKADQCELLEYQTNKYQDQQKHQQQTQQVDSNNKTALTSLAERKALLREEFFKDFPHTTVTDYCKTTATTTTVSATGKLTATLSKRLLRKQHNLKLKIPAVKAANYKIPPTDSAASSETLTPNFSNKPSLVALRKLDLQRKIVRINCSAFPTAEKTSTNIFPCSQFPSVKELAKRFDRNPRKMIVPQTKANSTEMDMASLKPEALDQRNSPLSDEGCNLGQSPYSSDDDDNDSIRTTHTAIERLPAKRKDKVARSASSDSALGLEVDESMDTTEPQAPSTQQQQKRRMTLTVTDLPLRPALLPLAEPTMLPDSPPVDVVTNISVTQTQIPSKVLLEERVVEIPEDPRSGGSSRRESSQSCLSDYPSGDMQGVRFVRTPSVVVSDYSDDIMCGITLEEIEYFRAQRMRRRRSSLDTSGTEKDALDNNSDVSAASSCSNLYYCGSTISALDGAECLVNGMRMQLERKASDCSTCSVSGDEESPQNSFTIPEQPEDCQDLSDMLANQHLSCKRSKKVGTPATTGLLRVDNLKLP
ncbi:mucin-2-like isoform X1 [Stomoxys calcitrans]|uniref:mucin-2-like isoform X1 n=1 Tax=Stomoxys calcitrans TaxID=35570 RepID=UPI0027E223D3|nr:mucin-2-like isoform X1 [Stomoxys calcitrans]